MSKSYDVAFKLGAKLNNNYANTFNMAENIANKTVKSIGKTVAALGGLVLSAAAIKNSFSVYMDFEQSMANTSAIAGIEKGSEAYLKLEKAAMDAGKSTSKTATEAAEALGYMALAGWSVQESMDGLMPVLRLSEATGMDLAKASDMVTDTMAALGIEVDALPGYLDKVAKAQNSSNMSAEQLMQSYLSVGGTMKNFNVPLEESAAILGLMANRGTKGAEAGNSLNSIFVNLTAPLGRAKDALEELGFSAFDTEGNFIGLENSLYLLQDKLDGATDEQMAFFTSAIGGKTQLTQLQQILDGLGDEYENLKLDILNSDGALDKMAETMNNTMLGAFTRLKSAGQDFQINMVKQIEPYIVPVINRVAELLPDITEGIVAGTVLIRDSIRSFSDTLKNAGIFSSIAENALPVMDKIILVALDVKDKLYGAFNAAKPVLTWIFMEGLPFTIDLMISMIDKAVGLYNFINENWTLIGPVIMTIAVAIAAIKFVQLISNVYKTTAAFIIMTKAKIADKKATIQIMHLYAKDMPSSLMKTVKAIILNTKAFILNTKAKVIGRAKTLILSLAIRTLYAANLASIVVTKAMTIAQWAFNAALLANPITWVIAGIVALIAIGVLLYKNWDVVKEKALELWDKIKAIFGRMGEWFNNKVITPIKDFFIPIINFIVGVFSIIWDIVCSIWDAVATWFNDNVIQPVINYFESLKNKIIQFFENTWNNIVSVWTIVSTWFDENVIQPVLTFFNNLKDSVVQSFQNAWNGVIEIWNKIASWIDENVISPVVNLFKGIVEKISSIGEEITQTLKDMFCKPIDWIQYKWGGIKNFFSGILGQADEIAKKGESITGLNISQSTVKIPGYAKGSNYTPNTFIAGEAGAELITNSRGSKVFTAIQTGQIFNNISKIPSTLSKSFSGLGIEDASNNIELQSHRSVLPLANKNDSQSIIVNYSPQIKVEGSSSKNEDIGRIIQEVLDKDKPKLIQLIKDILKNENDRKVRLSND